MSRTAMLIVASMMIAPVAASEQSGGWTLTCAAGEPCLLRLNKRFLDKAGITGALEVRAIGAMLVPVVALRGLSAEVLIAAAMAGRVDATMQFNNARPEDLICAASAAVFICAPQDDPARRLAAALPAARTVTVRLSVAVAGMKPLPVQERSLGLSGTPDALAKLRSAPVTAPAAGGIMDKMLRSNGYPNGLSDLAAWLAAKYRGK